jgi:hypothetical protein
MATFTEFSSKACVTDFGPYLSDFRWHMFLFSLYHPWTLRRLSYPGQTYLLLHDIAQALAD